MVGPPGVPPGGGPPTRGGAGAPQCLPVPAARSLNGIWSLRPLGRPTPRRWGATEGGAGVLQVGGAFVQYAQPSASGSPPSWSRPSRGGPQSTSNHGLRAPAREPERARQGKAGRRRGEDTRLRHHDPAGSPVSTALTSPSLPSKRSSRILGIPQFVFGVRRRSGGDVSSVDTDDPPDLLHRPFGVSRATDPIAELLPERAPQKP